MARNFSRWPVLLVLLAGCAYTPVKPVHKEAPVDQPLPLRLAVDMSPEKLAENKVHYYYYAEIYYPEGKLVRNAAITAFAPLVKQVLPREEMPAPDLIIKVSGKSEFNPAMRVFYADVTATGYLASGEEIGTFSASSDIGGVVSSYERTFAKAYVAAFQEIARKFLQSGALSAAASRHTTD
jgi:hypothetical protein